MLRRSPAFRPSSARSKPGNRDSSPQEKVAGSPPKVLSISVPSIRRTAKCSVMRRCGPARSGSFMAMISEQHVDDDQCRPDGDGTVGNIEGREMPAGPMEVEKVHHV